MKVRALRLGYHDHRRRKAGDVFNIKGEHEVIDPVTKQKKTVTDFSKEWMEEVDGGEEVTRTKLRDDRQDASVEPTEENPEADGPIEAEQPHGRKRKHRDVI